MLTVCCCFNPHDSAVGWCRRQETSQSDTAEITPALRPDWGVTVAALTALHGTIAKKCRHDLFVSKAKTVIIICEKPPQGLGCGLPRVYLAPEIFKEQCIYVSCLPKVRMFLKTLRGFQKNCNVRQCPIYIPIGNVILFAVIIVIAITTNFFSVHVYQGQLGQ